MDLAPSPLLTSKTKPRHSWGAPTRFLYKTERACINGCRIVKVTRHESGEHWTEFYRDGEKIEGEGTPGCI